MLTDITFDFFGTLVGYTPGAFHEPYTVTHQVLHAEGFKIPYEVFAEGYSSVCDRLEEQAQRTRIEYHHHESAEIFFREVIGTSVAASIRDRFAASFIAEWSRGTRFYPYIRNFLESLASHYRLSIISNTHYPPMIHDNLRAMKVDHLFASVITSVEFGIRKPDPRIFHAALAALDVNAAQAVYVGDTYEDDYVGARAAGLRCILIDPAGRWQEQAVDRVASLVEIAALLR